MMTGSFNQTNALKALPEIIRVSRHYDGNPFKLQKVQSSEKLKHLNYTDLERILKKRIAMVAKKPTPSMKSKHVFKNGNNWMELMQQQIFLCPRRDMAFLKCFGMSHSNYIKTIFGIPEDNQCPQLDIICYQAEECKKQRKRVIRGPHSDWKRASFVTDVETRENIATTLDESTKMLWIDLRKFQRENKINGDGPLVSTEAGIMQFLRSILTPSHHTSPWEAAAKSTTSREEATGELQEPMVLLSDIVVFAMNYPSTYGYDNDFKLLKKFRVSDATPSWFLHGFVHLKYLEQSLDEILHEKYDGVYSDEAMKAPTSTSTLMIYKKLSSRHLLRFNPVCLAHDHVYSAAGKIKTITDTDSKAIAGEKQSIHTVVDKGCLWEAYEARDIDYESLSLNCEKHGNDVKATAKETIFPQENRRYRLVSPPYLNLDEEYPRANLVTKLFSKQAIQIFTEDALSVPRWTPWPETAHYKVSSFGNAKPWTVFPLCHCFPADEPDKFTWVAATKSFVPRTCRLLEEALSLGNDESYLRTALFSQLAPRSILEEHTGWADLANHVLRLHIPLVVPSSGRLTGDDLCGTWVDGCVETHAVGRPLLFDDSKTHRAFNYSDGDRIVLIVDLARPDRLPLGTAESGHTEELDSFIEQMSVPK